MSNLNFQNQSYEAELSLQSTSSTSDCQDCAHSDANESESELLSDEIFYSEPVESGNRLNRQSSMSFSFTGLRHSQSGNNLYNHFELESDTSASSGMRTCFSDTSLSSKYQPDDIDDIDVKLAAQALGDLKNSGSPIHPMYKIISFDSFLLDSYFPQSQVRQTTIQTIPDATQNLLASSPSSQHFLDRFVGIPVINRSINTISSAYEATKATSSVLKVS
ncbi:hypothetical protein HK096_007602 [Nowakowskiella sp. JEL0078]|nr:hypothetical protein HK096_007602 [Nowakowskiella sp. JEL0078]